MPPADFQPGFRLSATDVVVLVVGSGAATGVATVDTGAGAAVAWVVGHFFLFCNVLRMARVRELMWAGLFVGLAAGTSIAGAGTPEWAWVFGLSGAATAVLGIVELRAPSYHGVGWAAVNPGLPQWWEHRPNG